MDYRTILDQASNMLKNFNIQNPRLDSELLLSNSLKISRENLLLNLNNQINFNAQYHKSIRNFIRKWGVLPSDIWNRKNGDIIIPNKYDIGFIVNNCNYKILHLLEPWCSNIYIEDKSIISKYLEEEQKNTLYDLTNRVHLNKNILHTKIIVKFDAAVLNNEERVVFLQSLSRYLSENKKIGEVIHDIFILNINSLDSIKNIDLLPIHLSSKIKNN